jgi:hypothetical protein
LEPFHVLRCCRSNWGGKIERGIVYNMRTSVIGILAVAALAASSFAIDTSVAREGHGGGGGGGRGGGGGHAAFSGGGGGGGMSVNRGGGGMSFNRGGSGPSYRAQTASPRFSSGPSVGGRGYAVSPRVRGGYTAYSGNRYTGNYGNRYAGNYGNRYAGNYGNNRRGHRWGYGSGWPLAVGAIGAYGAYAAYGYDSYDSCYQPQRVWTPYGWTWQQVYVCGDDGGYGYY